MGVVGLGVMGLGIAQVMARAGHEVLATDADAAAQAGARDRLAGALDRGGFADGGAVLERVRVVGGPEAMGGAGLVIEAIAESPEAKRALFANLEGVLAADAVLATNTSSLPVAALAEGLRHPGRALGLHFFNPAPVMRLVELVRHAGTSEEAAALARGLAEGAGKTVVDAPDAPGFIVNRCARPFYGEALALLEQGRTPSDVDAAMGAAGYRMGPFALIDLVGADINLAATRGLSAAMGGHPRFHVFAALEDQVAAGALGRKAGRGFLFPDKPGVPPADADALAERIEATLVNEAGWLLAEGGVAAAGIDAAMRLGLNWPRGPFEILARRGARRLREVLAALESRTPLPGRYAPAPILEAR